MNKFRLFVYLLLNIPLVSGKNAGQMTQQQMEAFYTAEQKSNWGIQYPIQKIYQYSDKLGKNQFVLTEDGQGRDNESHPEDWPVNAKIKGFWLQNQKNQGWQLMNTVQDTILDNEHSIWFWPKYSVFEDLDKDGMVDPIIVYGSSSDSNGLDEGRIKIMVIYRGEKIFIRHLNDTLDSGRKTQVDKKFYSLPLPIQNKVKAQMKRIMADRFGIFPRGWEKKMMKKQTHIVE